MRDDPERDARVVRRALRAGLVTWAVPGVALAALAFGAGHDGQVGLVLVLLALVAGALMTSGWLVVATLLDLLADRRPGRRRLAWMFGAVAFAFVSPVFVLGAQGPP